MCVCVAANWAKRSEERRNGQRVSSVDSAACVEWSKLDRERRYFINDDLMLATITVCFDLSVSLDFKENLIRQYGEGRSEVEGNNGHE